MSELSAVLKIDGTEVPTIAKDAAALRFSEGLGLLDSLTLSWFPSGEDAWMEKVQLGKEYELVLADGAGEDQKFSGLIAALDHRRTATGEEITAHGVDLFFKLKNKYRTRVWDELTPKDILGEIVGDHGLTADYQGPELKASTWFQDGTTDAAFLTSLAEQYGCYVRVREKKLVFGRRPIGAAGITVKGWDNVSSLTVKLGLDGLLTAAAGRAWDPETDKEVKGKAAGKLQDIGGSKKTADSVFKESKGGAAELFVGAAPHLLKGHLDAYLDATMQDAGLGLVTGTAVVHDQPCAVSGRTLTIENCGGLSGKYLIAASEHQLNEASGFSARLSLISDSLPEGKE